MSYSPSYRGRKPRAARKDMEEVSPNPGDLFRSAEAVAHAPLELKSALDGAGEDEEEVGEEI